jgi:hypothetical protein
MEMKYSNRVFVVSLGGKGDGWKITYRDVVEQKNQYFFPVGSRWPDPPPNYLAFRYDGNLQSIHHVKSYATVKGGVKGSQCGGVKVVQWKVMDLRGGWRLERSGRRHPPRSAFGGRLLGLGC